MLFEISFSVAISIREDKRIYTYTNAGGSVTQHWRRGGSLTLGACVACARNTRFCNNMHCVLFSSVSRCAFWCKA